MPKYVPGMLILSKQEFNDLNYRINNPTKEEQKARTNFFDSLTKNIHIIEESHCRVVAEIDDFDDSFMDSILYNDCEKTEWKFSMTYDPPASEDFYFTTSSEKPNSFNLKNKHDDEWMYVKPKSLIA